MNRYAGGKKILCKLPYRHILQESYVDIDMIQAFREDSQNHWYK